MVLKMEPLTISQHFFFFMVPPHLGHVFFLNKKYHNSLAVNWYLKDITNSHPLSLVFFDGRREGFSLFFCHTKQHDDCIIAPLLCSRSAAAGNPVYVFPRQPGFKAPVQDTNLPGNHIVVRRVCDGQDASAKIQKTVPVSDDIPVPPFNPPLDILPQLTQWDSSRCAVRLCFNGAAG